MTPKRKKIIVLVSILTILIITSMVLVLLFSRNNLNSINPLVKVVIIDSGVSNEQLSNERIVSVKSFVNIENGYSGTDNTPYDYLNHGQLIVSEVLKSSYGFLYIAKIAASNGEITHTGVLEAMKWAVNEVKANIINLSLGYVSRENDELITVINDAIKKGIMIIAAAGNSNHPKIEDWGCVDSPGAIPAVLTVGAVDSKNNPLDTTSIGPGLETAPKPSIAALGITSGRSGTSFATPRVTKTAVNLWGEYLKETRKNPALGIIWWLLLSTTDKAGTSERLGLGILNETRALNKLHSYLETPVSEQIVQSLPEEYLNEPIFMNETRWFTFLVASTYNTTITVESNYTNIMVIQENLFQENLFLIRIKIVGEAVNQSTSTWFLKGITEDEKEQSKIVFNKVFTTRVSRGFLGLDTRFSIELTDTWDRRYWSLYKYGHYLNYSVISFRETPLQDLSVFTGVLVLDVGKRLLIGDSLEYTKPIDATYINSLQTFVSQGGRLVFASTHEFLADSTVINQVLEPFGIGYSDEVTVPLDAIDPVHAFEKKVEIITELSNSPLFSTVLWFSFRGATLIETPHSSEVVVSSMAFAELTIKGVTDNYPVIMESSLGNGKVLVFGGSMVLDNLAFNNGRSTNYDNYLAMNTMLFLTKAY